MRDPQNVSVNVSVDVTPISLIFLGGVSRNRLDSSLSAQAVVTSSLESTRQLRGESFDPADGITFPSFSSRLFRRVAMGQGYMEI